MKKIQRSWNSTLRTMSKKRQALMRRVAPQVKRYRAEFHMCQCCYQRKATDLHHICRGAAREEALEHVAAWLVVCRECHDELGDFRLWPITRQCALKMLRDPARFDLSVINKLRGRSETAIDLADVTKHLELKERTP